MMRQDNVKQSKAKAKAKQSTAEREIANSLKSEVALVVGKYKAPGLEGFLARCFSCFQLKTN